MEPQWCFHGFQWCSHSDFMGSHGAPMVFSWTAMAPQRCFYYGFIVLSWTPMVLSWCFHGASMASPSYFNQAFIYSHGASMVHSWIPKVISWTSNRALVIGTSTVLPWPSGCLHVNLCCFHDAVMDIVASRPSEDVLTCFSLTCWHMHATWMSVGMSPHHTFLCYLTCVCLCQSIFLLCTSLPVRAPLRYSPLDPVELGDGGAEVWVTASCARPLLHVLSRTAISSRLLNGMQVRRFLRGCGVYNRSVTFNLMSGRGAPTATTWLHEHGCMNFSMMGCVLIFFTSRSIVQSWWLHDPCLGSHGASWCFHGAAINSHRVLSRIFMDFHGAAIARIRWRM